MRSEALGPGAQQHNSMKMIGENREAEMGSSREQVEEGDDDQIILSQ